MKGTVAPSDKKNSEYNTKKATKRRETYNEEFALVFEQVKELSDKIQLAVEVPRITQRQVYRNNPPHTTPEEYYRRVVFIPMLDSVISDLKSRFSRDTLNSFRLTVLLPSNIVNCTDDLLQSSVKEISSMYRSTSWLNRAVYHGNTYFGRGACAEK
ncbi:hypothetical protein QYM36_005961 [Artemia franciscana]|uniref:Uncharacterized protein n=1 Tax=Artemia franciscana TaxID=6661 RepID=A0AA88HVE9_ARTSF|nr:hypothetical protein QYM36_005961 [Artemia franciscana]